MFRTQKPKLHSRKNLSSCLKIKIITYKTIIFTTGILHFGKRTDWKRVGVFENRVLRRISEPNRWDLTGGRWKLHEQLRVPYTSPIITAAYRSTRGLCNAWEIREMHNKVWWGNLIKQETTYKTYALMPGYSNGFSEHRMGVEFIWLRREINLGFQKMERISLLSYDSLSFPSTLLHGNISVFVYN